MRATAGLAALGLAAIGTVYVARRSISPVYLLDSTAELYFALHSRAIATRPASPSLRLSR